MATEAYLRPQDSRFDAFLEGLEELLPNGWQASLQLEDPLTLLLEEVGAVTGGAREEVSFLSLAPTAEGLGEPPDRWLLSRFGYRAAEILPLAGERPFGRVLLLAGTKAPRLDRGRRRRLEEYCKAAIPDLERARSHSEDAKFASRLRRIAEAELAERFTRAAVALLPSVVAAAVLVRDGDALTVLRAWSAEGGSQEEYLRRSLPWASSHLRALLEGHEEQALLAAEDMGGAAESRLLEPLIRKLRPKAVETLPLETGVRLAGSLLLFYDREALEEEEHQVAGRLAEALTRAFDRIRPERRQASSLLYLQELLRSSGSGIEPVLETVVQEMVRFLGADAGVLALLDSDTGKLLFSEQSGYGRGVLPEAVPTSQEGPRSISAHVMQTGEPYLATDTRDSAVYLPIDPTIRSEAGVPLRLRGETFGVAVASSRTPGFFVPEDLRRFQLFADQVAVAVDNARFLDTLRRQWQERTLRRQRQQFGFHPSGQAEDVEYHFGNLVGDPGGPMGEVYRAIERVAGREDDTVLIVGETGTGKEMVAHAIHAVSPRSSRPLTATNFAALGGDSNLIQSELFGHEKGAFTGAIRRRKGCFETAHRSTLLIDELGDLIPSVQVKLLRVLGRSSRREFVRLGGEDSVTSDVRVLAATNKDLRLEVAEGRFREDLYYRLAALVVAIPPLRRRPGDVPMLSRHILVRLQPDEPVRLEQSAVTALQAYPWPGNVRQLESVLLRALVMYGSAGTISSEDVERALELENAGSGSVPQRQLACPDPPPDGWFWNEVWEPFKDHRLEKDAVRSLIERTLAETGGFYTRTAERLGVSRADYQRFLDFLTHSELRVDFRPYRKTRSSADDEP